MGGTIRGASAPVPIAPPVVESGLEGKPDVIFTGTFGDAIDFLNSGRLNEARSVVKEILRRQDVESVLEAIASRTASILDASDISGPRWEGVTEEEATKLMLSDKARELQQWVALLSDCTAWTCLPDTQATVALRQSMVEAVERVAVAGCLRELDDRWPDVFAIAIAAVAPKGGSAATAGSIQPDRLAFYSQVTACERVLLPLAQLPRALPLGSSDVFDAVLLVNEIAVTFLDTALSRRRTVVEAYPLLLPRRVDTTGSLFGSGPALPAGEGSKWLTSATMRSALRALRQVSLDVLPASHLLELPLLAAQSLRVVESLAAMCAITLLAEVATLGRTSEAGTPQPLKQEVLTDLVEAELHIIKPPQCPNRTLRLAENFEDLDTLVLVAARYDKPRLQTHMDRSVQIRMHALQLFLANRELLPLFYAALDRHQIQLSAVEDMLKPYPEIRWTLELQRFPPCGGASEPQWEEMLERVRGCTSAAAKQEADNLSKRDGLLAIAHIAAAAARA